MDLLHHFVDVDGVGFLSFGPSLLLFTNYGLLAGFLFTFFPTGALGGIFTNGLLIKSK
jgi:hypothetical protein